MDLGGAGGGGGRAAPTSCASPVQIARAGADQPFELGQRREWPPQLHRRPALHLVRTRSRGGGFTARWRAGPCALRATAIRPALRYDQRSLVGLEGFEEREMPFDIMSDLCSDRVGCRRDFKLRDACSRPVTGPDASLFGSERALFVLFKGRKRLGCLPRAYRARPHDAGTFTKLLKTMVELRGIEPLTSAVRLQRSPI